MEIPVSLHVMGRWLGEPSLAVAIEIVLERLLGGLGAVVHVCPSGVGCVLDEDGKLIADVEIRRGAAVLRGTVYGACASHGDWLDCRLHRIVLYL
jgi:hypothetical protein